jgi:hypothetical protein
MGRLLSIPLAPLKDRTEWNRPFGVSSSPCRISRRQGQSCGLLIRVFNGGSTWNDILNDCPWDCDDVRTHLIPLNTRSKYFRGESWVREYIIVTSSVPNLPVVTHRSQFGFSLVIPTRLWGNDEDALKISDPGSSVSIT